MTFPKIFISVADRKKYRVDNLTTIYAMKLIEALPDDVLFMLVKEERTPELTAVCQQIGPKTNSSWVTARAAETLYVRGQIGETELDYICRCRVRRIHIGDGKEFMKRTSPIDLSRTKAAIDAYDIHDETFAAGTFMNNFDALTWFGKLETLGKAVGHAFGEDTADCNSMSTCESCIRPGHKVPAPGCELSFVRRMVKQWERS